MLNPENLKEHLHYPALKRQEKILLCLAVTSHKPKPVKQIRDMAIAAGLREAAKWNLSAVLGSLGHRAIRTKVGWEITATGKAVVQEILTKSIGEKLPAVSALRKTLNKITPGHTREFVKEAVECFEGKHYRAAVVLSWVGALSLLYNYVAGGYMKAFNAEARRRDAKWKDAKSTDDLARIKEYDFLQILEAISVAGKSVKIELEGCLKLRNGCGHPNSLKVEQHRVSSHVEVLILNVFSVFN